MGLLTPTKIAKKITDIDINTIKKFNIRIVALDIDNTITFPDSVVLLEGVEEWIKKVKRQNVDVVLISNNYRKRNFPIVENLNIKIINFAVKPIPFRIKSYFKKLGVKSYKNLMFIGDQIFTDILVANIIGAKSILLEPLVKEKSILLKFKRGLERSIRKNLK